MEMETEPTYSETSGFRVRMPTELHELVRLAAKDAGMSMNTWIVRRLAEIVAQPTAPTLNGSKRGGRAETFEATVGFTLSGPDAADTARRLLDQFEATAGLASGNSVSARLARVEPIPRSA